MPGFALPHFYALATRFFAELEVPWPSSPPVAEVTESEVPYGEDPKAQQTVTRWAEGDRALVLTRIAAREWMSSLIEHSARIEGIARGVSLELLGGVDLLERYRVTGPDAAAVAVEDAWVRFCERVFRDVAKWKEHPAIPAEWIAVANAPGFTRGFRHALVGLPGSTVELVHDEVSWLVTAFARLDPPRDAPFWMIGPVPPLGKAFPWDREECTLVCYPPAESSTLSPVAVHRLFALLVGERNDERTSVYDATKMVMRGQAYGPIAPRRDGVPEPWPSKDVPTEEPIGEERTQVWRQGEWILRTTELRSATVPDSFDVAVQSPRGPLALLGHGHARAKPDHPMPFGKTFAPETAFHLFARRGTPLDGIVAELVREIEKAGWRVGATWTPSRPPVTPMRRSADRLHASLTEAEARRVRELTSTIAARLREGWEYEDSYREEWSRCRHVDGKLVWSCGSFGPELTETIEIELADEDALAARLVPGGTLDGPSIVRALEEAAERVRRR
jgi:hypothetical protein